MSVNKKHLKQLRSKKNVKLKLMERAMIAIALADYGARIRCDDKDGKAMAKAYDKLHKRMSKECKP